MDINLILQSISVLIECAVVVLALRIATKGAKEYGWLIAATFALYVVFDLSRLGLIPVPEGLAAPFFLIASVSALLAVFLILRDVTGTTIRSIDREWL
jgi:hypothetical protein